MAWAEPTFSKDNVNLAGKTLRASFKDYPWSDDAHFQAYLDAVKVANNWRAAHAFPLNTFQVGLRRVVKRIEPKPIVAQRIKRLVSIERKLVLIPSMRLSQMQDLGGCRAILANVRNVQAVHDFYTNASSMRHSLLKVDNYVENPKASGYRGIHLIYQYTSDRKGTVYNGQRIEIQLRSRYQHAWATTVETVGMFSGQALKSSLGSDDWKRFFSLMGSAIAHRELRPTVPSTPLERVDLIKELNEYAQKLQVDRRLRDYRNALKSIASQADARDFFYLLELDPSTQRLDVTGFRKNESAKAEERYADAEQEVRKNPGRDAVLVSVDSVNALSRAYPNYFADTRIFLDLMNQAISGKARSIKERASLFQSAMELAKKGELFTS